MTSDSECFYRIEHEGTLWRAGQKFGIGDTDNEFTRNWKAQSTTIPYGDPPEPTAVNLALGSIYNAVIDKANASKRLAELRNLPPTFRKVVQSLDDSLLANREFTFEIVRLDFFPFRPSRMRCLFLIPDRVECIRFWWNELKTQGAGRRRLFRVRAKGTRHRVNQDFLMPLRTCAIDEWTKRAHAYWADQLTESDSDELLFVGDVTVEKEVDPGHFGCMII